jgi:hypothetical protein
MKLSISESILLVTAILVPDIESFLQLSFVVKWYNLTKKDSIQGKKSEQYTKISGVQKYSLGPRINA